MLNYQYEIKISGEIEFNFYIGSALIHARSNVIIKNNHLSFIMRLNINILNYAKTRSHNI